jgi:large subunit ribosomal protein L6
MSKLARKPIQIPEGVTVSKENQALVVKGKTNTLMVPILPHISVTLEQRAVVVATTGEGTQARANWGTEASLIRNALIGVTAGFKKTLEIEGIGYKASLEGNTLVLSVGYTHPVKYAPGESVKIEVQKNSITVSGPDKALVGQAAAEIRKVKKPEPYKGKGIRYFGEVIRRKAGKKVAGAADAKK